MTKVYVKIDETRIYIPGADAALAKASADIAAAAAASILSTILWIEDPLDATKIKPDNGKLVDLIHTTGTVLGGPFHP